MKIYSITTVSGKVKKESFYCLRCKSLDCIMWSWWLETEFPLRIFPSQQWCILVHPMSAILGIQHNLLFFLGFGTCWFQVNSSWESNRNFRNVTDVTERDTFLWDKNPQKICYWGTVFSLLYYMHTMLISCLSSDTIVNLLKIKQSN